MLREYGEAYWFDWSKCRLVPDEVQIIPPRSNEREHQVVAATINRPLSRKRESAPDPDSVGTKGGDCMKRERLILERNKRKKTQSEVALELGISEVYVRKLESGSVKPGRDTMLKFENYYGLGAKKLFPDIFFSNNDKKFIKTGTE